MVNKELTKEELLKIERNIERFLGLVYLLVLQSLLLEF